jgi:plastocyanin
VRKLCLLAATGLVSAVVAVPALAAVKTVKVGDNYFRPKTLTVKRGTTVRWVWGGKAPHNVTVTRGPVKFHSATKRKGAYSKRLTRKGTYSIVCTIHQALGQRMTLKVT